MYKNPPLQPPKLLTSFNYDEQPFKLRREGIRPVNGHSHDMSRILRSWGSPT